jgi:hypothetical protein
MRLVSIAGLLFDKDAAPREFCGERGGNTSGVSGNAG